MTTNEIHLSTDNEEKAKLEYARAKKDYLKKIKKQYQRKKCQPTKKRNPL